MDTQTLKRLEEAGFASTTVEEFLGLSPAENALVETKVRWTQMLKAARHAANLTQAQLAERLGTTQQVIARAENGHKSVTLDLLLRALIEAGVTLSQLGDQLRALDTPESRSSLSSPLPPPEVPAIRRSRTLAPSRSPKRVRIHVG